MVRTDNNDSSITESTLSNDTSTPSNTNITDTTATSSGGGWIFSKTFGELVEKIEKEIAKLLQSTEMKRGWECPEKCPKVIKTVNSKPIHLRPLKTVLRPRWFPRSKTNKNRKHGEL